MHCQKKPLLFPTFLVIMYSIFFLFMVQKWFSLNYFLKKLLYYSIVVGYFITSPFASMFKASCQLIAKSVVFSHLVFFLVNFQEAFDSPISCSRWNNMPCGSTTGAANKATKSPYCCSGMSLLKKLTGCE